MAKQKLTKTTLPIKKEFTSDNIQFISLSEQVEPQYSIDRSKEYVFRGKDGQNWNTYLQGMLHKCPIHKSIFRGKVKMTYGGGFFFENENELNAAQLTKVNKFFDNLSETESNKEFLRKTAYDLQLSSNFAWKIRWSLNGKSIEKVEHIDFSRIMSGKYNSEGKIDTYLYCNDWDDTRNNVIKPYPAFNVETATSDGEQILLCKDYEQGLEGMYYGTESYRAGLNAMEASYLIMNFHKNNLKNGMTPTIVISMEDDPTQEEKDNIYRKIKKLYAGAENAGKFILTFGTKGLKIDPIDTNDADKKWTVLLDQIISYIMIAHQVTSPMLFGLKASGQLAGRTEMIEASELFYTQVIEGDQQLILDSLTKLLKVNKLDFVKPAIKKLLPVKFMFNDPNTINRIFSINDLRRMTDTPLINSAFANALMGESAGANNNDTNSIAAIQAQAQANLRGSVGGVQGLLQIQASVAAKTTSFDAGLQMLSTLFGFDDQTSRVLLGNPKQPTTQQLN